MGFFSSIARVVYKEYDRRIKRASLITEYGAAHHGHGHDDQAEEAHEEHSEESEIVNVPRGTPVGPSKH